MEPRVALLSFDLVEYTAHLANALSAKANVALFLPQQESAAHSSQLNPAVQLRPFHKPRYRQPIRQLRMIGTLLREIGQQNPDVLHVQQGHLWFNLALPMLRAYPLVMTIHDPRHHVGDHVSRHAPQPIMDFGFRQADQIIVHSQQSRRVVVDELGVPGEIVHVIPHILIGDDPATVSVEEEEHTVLFFGRIWAYKGLEYLIRAEPFITERVPDAKIVIAGQGEDLARYRRMMVHPERFVVQNEYISEDKRAALFTQASIVVLPYIDASQSGVIPVAYAFAKPVVATTVGGLPELVEDGRTGYLVPPQDEKALADAIVSLLMDGTLRRQMGANAIRKAQDELSPSAIAEQTLAVYEQALSERTGSVHANPKATKVFPPWQRLIHRVTRSSQ